jgi:3-oxoacyl-[acyl-carrier-protein] synthase II
VALTGIGSVGALGVLAGTGVADAIMDGAPGVGAVRGFRPEGGSRLAGEVADLEPHLGPEETRRTSRATQLALVAARLALTDAGLEPGSLPDLAIVVGSHWGDIRSAEAFFRGHLERGPLGLSPLVFPYTVMNGIGAQLAIALGARGPLVTLNQPGLAGTLAVARGALLVRTGRAPAVLAGGVDDLAPVTYRELARLGVTSRTEPGPEGCWPFDRRANGTVLGEGATFVLLEAEPRARARRAPVRALLAGATWGSLPGSAPIRRALHAARVDLAEVDAIYLAGTGNPTVDARELDSVAELVGTAGPTACPVLTALTPRVGAHAGADVLAAAVAAATVERGSVPALPDLRMPVRPDLPVATASREVAGRAVVVQAVARGGAVAALVLAPADARRAA